MSGTATTGKDLDCWLEKVKRSEYLAEDELKALCDYVKEVLVEESNVQPVNSPVTVRARHAGALMISVKLDGHGVE